MDISLENKRSPSLGVRLSSADERKKNILLMLVEEYISRAKPISSSYITRRPNVNLSAATIRSTFICLEEEGYLFSPHRSAGRLPTEKAYRYYIENLAPPSRQHIKKKEQSYIKEQYLKKNLAVEDILATTSHILSILTCYAAVILGPAAEEAALKHVELIDMGANEVMVIFVTRTAKVLSHKIFVEERIPVNALRSISDQLNKTFQGRSLSEVQVQLPEEIKQNLHHEYYSNLAAALERNFKLIAGNREVYQEGLGSLHSQLKQESLTRLNEIVANVNLLDNHTLWRQAAVSDLQVMVAGEYDKDLSGVSVVSGSYEMGGKPMGSISVIGPNRMNYLHVLSLVEYVRCLISNMLTRMSN